MRKWILIASDGKKVAITVDEPAKRDFMLMMGWNQYEWDIHMRELKGGI